MVAKDRIRREEGRDKIITLVLAGLMMALFAVEAHGESEDQIYWGLFDLGSLGMTTVDFVGDAKSLDVTERQIARDIELALMRKNVPMGYLEAKASGIGMPHVWTTLRAINHMEPNQDPWYSISIDVRLMRLMPLAGTASVWAPVWYQHTFGSLGPGQIRTYARDSILDLVEQLSEDYLMANSQKAFEKYVAKYMPDVEDQEKTAQILMAKRLLLVRRTSNQPRNEP